MDKDYIYLTIQLGDAVLSLQDDTRRALYVSARLVGANVRKIKNTGLFKPYAIIDQKMFDAEIGKLKK